MDVNASEARDVQDGLGDDLTERRHHNRIGGHFLNKRNEVIRADSLRLVDRDSGIERDLLHGRNSDFSASARRTVRLSHDADHLMPGCQQLLESGNGEWRCPHEENRQPSSSSCSSSVM